MTTPSVSARPNALDRLRSIYESPGPYTSLYLPCGAIADTDPIAFFAENRAQLADKGSPPAALDALHARCGLPLPDDVGGWALHAAADGSTVVDFAPEGPAAPIMTVGALPMAAPMLEWDQWRIPHVAVSVGESASEVVTFLPGAEPAISPLPVDTRSAASALRLLAKNELVRLIVIAEQGGEADELVTRLQGVVPPRTNVVKLDETDAATVHRMADATVRYVADVVARDTVRSLEDFRFMQSTGDAVEGNDASFAALASGNAQMLLVHDDPNDPAAASFGAKPHEVSAVFDHYPSISRRADVAIWSAVKQGVNVRIIPTTSETGPDDNIGVILATAAVADLA